MSYSPSLASPRRAFLALCAGLLVCALCLPLRGRVVYSNIDLRSYFLPEMEVHLHRDHGIGPALWNPDVQLGRPAGHFGGLSQAYWLNHVFAWLLDDVWEVHGALVLATLVLGGLFAWGLFRTLDLHPWAAAACALGFAFGPFHGHAGMYLCFVGGSAWTMGLAWALARNLKASTLPNGILLAFVVHSAILASYPQQLVYAAWFTLPLGLALLPPRGQRSRRLLALMLWALVGVVSAAPFLLDLREKALASARMEIDTFYHQVPPLTGLRDLMMRLRELGDPLWNGHKTFTGVAHFMWGASLTPFFGAVVLLTLVKVRSRVVLAAGAFVLATVLFSLSPTLFHFGVRNLGFWLSIFHPFAAATAAVFLLAAIGFDHVLRTEPSRRRGLYALVLPALLAAGALAAAQPLDALNTSVSLVLAGCAVIALVAPAWPVFALAALLSAVHYGVAALPSATGPSIEQRLVRNAEEAATVRRRIGDGRFAWAGLHNPPFLGCNTELFHGVASIHSFDSLSPQRYRDWTSRISDTGTEYRGRFFRSVVGTAGLETEDFARAGVRLVLSQDGIHSPVLDEGEEVHGVQMQRIVAPVPLAAWVPRSSFELVDGEARIPGPITRVGRPVERRDVSDDRVAFDLDAEEPGLLWLSQQHHRRWRARAGDARLETVVVDGIWQGVLVPAGAREVVLEFRPWLHWWWVPQLLFALAGLGLALRSAFARRPSAPSRTLPHEATAVHAGSPAARVKRSGVLDASAPAL